MAQHQLAVSLSDSLQLGMAMLMLMPDLTCTSRALQTSYMHMQHPTEITDCTAGQLSSPSAQQLNRAASAS